MTTIIRQTNIRECDLCDNPAGNTAMIFEIVDDETEQHRLLFLCRRHAKNIVNALPLLLRGDDDG